MICVVCVCVGVRVYTRAWYVLLFFVCVEREREVVGVVFLLCGVCFLVLLQTTLWRR